MANCNRGLQPGLTAFLPPLNDSPGECQSVLTSKCVAGVPLLSAVMSAAMTQLKDFTPQAIKDTLWAFATLGFTPNNHFLQGSVDQCLVLIAQFNPQNIANAIWAFAKFAYHPGR